MRKEGKTLGGLRRAMAQAVRRQLITAQVWVRSQVCVRRGGQSGNGTGFFPSTSDFLLSASFHQCTILAFIYMLFLPEGQTGDAWETSKKQVEFFFKQVAFNRTLFSFFKLLLPTRRSVDIAPRVRTGKPRNSGSIFPTLIRK